MLETISECFKNATEKLAGVRELDDTSIKESLREVRAALLEADVDFEVVKDFLARVKERALGEKVKTRARDASGRKIRVTPGQHFVRICEQELVELMGPVDPSLAKARGATSIMLVGLQGVGKTTIAAKLAQYFKKKGKKPLLVAADVYRPAAVDQLKTLGAAIGVPVYAGDEGELPPAICQAAAARARSDGCNVIIYDTAGRLSVDDELMRELEEIVRRVEPANTLLVCDALMGRDAVNVARTFKERTNVDGVVLTKIDGDARGGAALAVKAVTGVPIKFLGTGEGVDQLEEFRPEGLASRILGMGDIVGLVKDFEEVVDEKQAEEDAERILKGRFTLEDLVTQLKTIQKMGSLKDLFSKLPGMGGMADQVDEREMVKVEAMIGSMTIGERRNPDVIDKSRARRIADGSGHKIPEVFALLKRFEQMRAMMQAMGSNMGMMGKIPGMGRLAGSGGAPGMGMDPASLMAAMGGAPSGGSAKRRPRNADVKKKNKRQRAKKDRRKGRRK